VPAATPTDDHDLVVLRVPADPRYARVVRVAVSAYAVRLGIVPAAVEDLRLAVDEALILLMGSNDRRGEDPDAHADGPTIVITLDADGDRPPVSVVLQREPAPAATEPDPAARSRFEEIVPAGVSIEAVDQRRGRVALRHRG
jgi:hypothetical protein